MTLVSTKHTFAAIEKIKRDLVKFLGILSLVSMIVFSIYYGYLIYKNIESLLYIIIYSVLFIVVIVSFVLEKVFKSKEGNSRLKNRENYETKRNSMRIVKTFKYIAKSITVGIVIYEMFKYQNKDISLIFNIVSIVMLAISLISEFVIHFTMLYFDYIRIGFELDSDKSIVMNLNPLNNLSKGVDILNSKITKRKRYTNEEQMIRDMLKEEAKKIEKETKNKKIVDIKNNSLSIINSCITSIKKDQKDKIENQYLLAQSQSKDLIKDNNKLLDLLNKAENLLSTLPDKYEEFKYIPYFIELVYCYITKRYNDISKESIFKIIGVLLYVISPVDVISDKIPFIGFIDEKYVIGLCLKTVAEELEKFIEWKENNI